MTVRVHGLRGNEHVTDDPYPFELQDTCGIKNLAYPHFHTVNGR